MEEEIGDGDFMHQSRLVRFYNVLHIFVTCRSAPIIGAYLLMVFSSRHLMKLYRPFDLRWVLIAHNLLCSVLSLYSLVIFIYGLWEIGDVFQMEHTEGPIRHALFIYWLSKFIELMDTVYMLLRHKRRQISFLHVWHHSTITLLADWAYTRSCWPAIIPIVALNSAVHVVMYGYYALTALYPVHDFTWKKRITQMQIGQFLIAIAHGMYGYMYRGFCVYSVLYGLGMLGLFSNFYFRAFLRPRKKSRDDDVGDKMSGSRNVGAESSEGSSKKEN